MPYILNISKFKKYTFSSSWHHVTPTYGRAIDSSQQKLSPSDTYLWLDHFQQPAVAGTK
jgi:hypothetical protein